MIEMVNVLRRRGRNNLSPQEFKALLIALVIYSLIYWAVHKFFPDMEKKKRDTILRVIGTVLIIAAIVLAHVPQ